MSKIADPHDSIFKQFLSRPEMAVDFLQNYLPTDVVSLFDLTKLELQQDSYVDAALQKHFTDLLYKLQLKQGEVAYIYLLFEHKSYPDHAVPFQLLRYIVHIWEQKKDKQNKLPPILPLVFYHGPTRWTIGLEFVDQFKGPTELRPYWPNFCYELVDLSTYQDEELRGGVWLQVYLLIAKHIASPDLGKRLPEIFALVRELVQSKSGLGMLYTLLRYVSQSNSRVESADLQKAVEVVLPSEGGVLMSTLAEKWLEEGWGKGLAQGHEEGRAEGRAEALAEGVRVQRQTLLQILQWRFQLSDTERLSLTKQLAKLDNLQQLANLVNDALQATTFTDFVIKLARVLPQEKVD
ncbi:MAG: Rpn family recombination-promoting nuclease/putative transposase [Caldilineaceae bacterium]